MEITCFENPDTSEFGWTNQRGFDSLHCPEDAELPEPPTDRFELAVRQTVGSIMSRRATVDQVIERLRRRGFQPIEIEAVLRESSRRMIAVGKTLDHDFYKTCIKVGVLLLFALGMIASVAYPQHGRGVGILYSGILLGLGALVYGLAGKIFKR